MVLTLIGARPQFVKAAVVSKAFADAQIPETILHSGQHYDERMSNIFWDELNIPKAAFNLNVGSGSHAQQTAQMMTGLEEFILGMKEFPKAVLLYGDTNTTVAGSLVAAKLHIPVIHIEAGLRSFNRAMPEEINRVVTDHLSELLFCPSGEAVKQLEKEGITKNVYDVGDVMYDSFLTFSAIAKKQKTDEQQAKWPESFILLTLHRPVNTDHPDTLSKILHELSLIDKQIVWPVHPRNRQNLNKLKISENVVLSEPLSYFEMLDALESCAAVITDSGGLQKEAYWAKKPCVTVRDETEWVETLDGGWNQLATSETGDISSKLKRLPVSQWKPLYGEGTASQKIAQIVKDRFKY